MKKILIVNNNMKVGGVQKSLCNLLWAIEKEYDVTLLLFACVGPYMDQIPSGVRVIEADMPFHLLGLSQNECKSRPLNALLRAALVGFCRAFGFPVTVKWMAAGQKRLKETYDCAISFLHNGREKYFYGGVQTFVLRCVRASKKVAFLHCDYRNSGSNHPANNRELQNFDVIAACSSGCRDAFLEIQPEQRERCVTVRNCHRFDEIISLAGENPVEYDRDRLHVIVVSRLGVDKGVERALYAVVTCLKRGIPVSLHIVGEGVMEHRLKALAAELNVREYVTFYGEQSNPYRYMVNGDLFLMTSYHEAAPMVIDEARCLGIPVLTVRTTSSEEMVSQPGSGWVCDNDQQALNQALMDVLRDTDALYEMKERLKRQKMDNREAISQFIGILEGK